jgi:hypothetical protein
VSTISLSSSRSRALPVLLIAVCQLIAAVALAPWAVITGLSVMTTGAGALLPRPLLYLLWIYPLLPVSCGVAAWIAFRRGDTARAVRLSAVPLLLAVPLLAYGWYMAMPV